VITPPVLCFQAGQRGLMSLGCLPSWIGESGGCGRGASIDFGCPPLHIQIDAAMDFAAAIRLETDPDRTTVQIGIGLEFRQRGRGFPERLDQWAP
jgi:hypothetical protein